MKKEICWETVEFLLHEAIENLERLNAMLYLARTGEMPKGWKRRLDGSDRINEAALEHVDWNAPGYDAGETAKFPKGFLPLKGDDAPRSHYERYVRWAKKNKAVEKPISSLPELVAKAFLTDPQYRNFPRWEGLAAGAFYPDFGERVRYCKERQPGWEDLAESLGEALRENAYWRQENFRDELPQNVSFAMEKGDPANFLIHLAISGFHFTR